MTLASFLALVVTLIVGVAGPYLILPLLRRLEIVDVPNHRSSHIVPVVRGGGLAPWLAIAVGLVIFVGSGVAPLAIFPIGFVALSAGALGWLEDHRGIGVGVRAGCQLAIGVIGVAWLALISGVTPGFVVLGAIFVAGFINVANFMDGVNAISGFYAVVVGTLLALVGHLSDRWWLTFGGLLVAAAFAGFLILNVRGSIFLGDVGSYLLGGAVSILVVAAIFDGVSVMAVGAPTLLYLADTSITLVKRVLAGDKWLEAHRSHIYQRLTNFGLTHLQVAGIVCLFTAMSGAVGVASMATSNELVLAGYALMLLCIVCVYVSIPRLLARRPHKLSSESRSY